MIDTENTYIDCISLVAACQCNLSCEYCLIAQAAANHKNSHKIQVENIKALQDGTYIKNILAVLKRLHQSPSQINGLQIWGQEPSMVIKYLTENIDDWLNAFPKLTTFMFSTNGMDYGEDVANFAIELDKHTSKFMSFELQLSYDGYFGQDSVRKGASDKILENVRVMAKKLNDYNYKHISIQINPHSVFSIDLAHELTTVEKATQYVDSLDNFVTMLNELCFNRNIHVGGVSVMGQTGSNATTEDGLAYAQAIRTIELVKMRRPHSQYLLTSPGVRLQIYGAIPKLLYEYVVRYGSLENLVDYSLENPKDACCNIGYCSTVNHDLKIMYDGTVLTCQNYLFDTMEDDLVNADPEEQTLEQQCKSYFMEKYHRVNFVTGTDEEIQRMLDFHSTISEQNFVYSGINSTANMIYLMAECGEVSESYLYDLNKLKRHAYVIASSDTCYANMLHASASVLIKSCAQIRLLCNGALDLLDEVLENAAKKDSKELTWRHDDSYFIDYDNITENSQHYKEARKKRYMSKNSNQEAAPNKKKEDYDMDMMCLGNELNGR